MEILKDFGFDTRLLVAQILNFLILFFLLKKLLYKPVFEMLKTRKETIKYGLEQAEAGKKALEKALVEEKAILTRAQTQAKKLLAETQKHSDKLLMESGEYSKKQAEKILQEAKEDIAKQIRVTEKNLSLYVSKLAVQFLEKSTEGLFEEKEQEEIVTKAIKRLKEKSN